jgi:hypothetical protein
MKDKSWTLTGWPAVPVVLMFAATGVLTALVLPLPVTWLVNHIFAAGAIHAVFGVDRLGYWRVVLMFVLVFVARFKITFTGPSK